MPVVVTIPSKQSDDDERTAALRLKRRRAAKICFLSVAAAAVVSGLTIGLVRTYLPEFEEHGYAEEGVLMNLNASLGNFSRFISEFADVSQDDHPPVASDFAPEGPIWYHAVVGMEVTASNSRARAALDVSLIERIDRDSSDPQYSERELRFSELAKDYLEHHRSEILDAPMGRMEPTEAHGDTSHRGLDVHGTDDRRGVGEAEARQAPFESIVRLSMGNKRCTGTLVGKDVVLTAAHCVYSDGKYHWPSVEVHPWKGTATVSRFNPSSFFDSGHLSCSDRIKVNYPCGYKASWCRRGWIRYPCNHRVKWCTRYQPPASDCTWRYSSRQIAIPPAWKQTACQASTDGSCAQSDFQHDIALVKLKKTQGGHAGTRAGSFKTPGWVHPMLASVYTSTPYAIAGYPGDKEPYMVTAEGSIEEADFEKTLLTHTIDASNGQSGAGLFSDGVVYGVHVYGGEDVDGARMVDQYWTSLTTWMRAA